MRLVLKGYSRQIFRSAIGSIKAMQLECDRKSHSPQRGKSISIEIMKKIPNFYHVPVRSNDKHIAIDHQIFAVTTSYI
jgi:hypothetical protein